MVSVQHQGHNRTDPAEIVVFGYCLIGGKMLVFTRGDKQARFLLCLQQKELHAKWMQKTEAQGGESVYRRENPCNWMENAAVSYWWWIHERLDMPAYPNLQTEQDIDRTILANEVNGGIKKTKMWALVASTAITSLLTSITRLSEEVDPTKHNDGRLKAHVQLNIAAWARNMYKGRVQYNWIDWK